MAISFKASRNWLQNYFDQELPQAPVLSDALTFHVVEVDGIEHDDVLDTQILPDRAPYLLCHRGVAKELSAILSQPMKQDPLREALPECPSTNELEVIIENPQKCLRYMAALVRGVNAGPSPAWLKEALESVGQRSINNVVDATNYVMLNIGQPLHAFDANLLEKKDGKYVIKVRDAQEGERITTLSGDEYVLPKDTLLITDSCADAPIGIAGIKGGKAAQITDATTDIIIESANFDGSSIRRAAQALKLFTDASQRFQNKISPELAAYGMRDVIELILAVAGGELAGVTDAYPAPAQQAPVSVTLDTITSVLGSPIDEDVVAGVFDRLGFSYDRNQEAQATTFIVTPPFERRDIVIPEDLVEEVGRIIGYDTIPATPLPPLETPADQSRYRRIEAVKDFMIEHGYTELSTQTFAIEGDITLANPLDQTRPALRRSLGENIRDALARAKTTAPRVLGPVSELKLFEVGTIFTKEGEHLSLAFGYEPLSGKKQPAVLAETLDQLIDLLGGIPGDAIMKADDVIEVDLSLVNLDGAAEAPKRVELGAYTPFSIYPFALRDVAVWTPELTEESEVAMLIKREAGELLVRIDLFDRFEKLGKDGEPSRISYAFRLVFESNERTLSDEDLNPLMEKVTTALNAQDRWEVR